MKHRTTALVLLVIGCAAAYGWQMVPEQHLGAAWYISQSLWQVMLLALLACVYRSRAVVLVCALLACFSLMVVGCEAAYLVKPWPMNPGDELCSARLNYPLGLLGAVIALGLVLSIIREKKR